MRPSGPAIVRISVAAGVEAAGGKVVMAKFRIETVGDLIYFEDTEGNRVGAMQYFEG